MTCYNYKKLYDVFADEFPHDKWFGLDKNKENDGKM